jgi:oxygen-independent coproporphyrinogen-3 oxidase
MRRRNNTRLEPTSPVSLYVHIPFCRSKCPYCAFYSVIPTPGEVTAFLEALEGEIGFLSKSSDRPLLRTAYIGGGTPTLLSPRDWERLITVLESAFSFVPTAEVTVEANPGSLAREHLALWKDWRVSRVSLGVQSLQDEDLLAMGRPHDSRQALDSMAEIKGRGLSLSVDLLFGLPAQKLRGWSDTLSRVLDEGAEHLSIYELTLEDGTPWGSHPPRDLAAGYPFYRWAQYYLEKKGLLQYEIASFSKPRRWCRHNVAYWSGAPFLGIGPSAWGYDGTVRTGNVADLEHYRLMIEKGVRPTLFSERLEGKRRAFELSALALRTRWGIRLQEYRRLWGDQMLKGLQDSLEGLPPRLFRKAPGRIALSKQGMRVGNAIWERLVP